jgi:hypothetical protein
MGKARKLEEGRKGVELDAVYGDNRLRPGAEWALTNQIIAHVS